MIEEVSSENPERLQDGEYQRTPRTQLRRLREQGWLERVGRDLYELPGAP